MKFKLYIAFVASLITFSSIAVSKITDPRVRTNFYNGCYKEYDASTQLSKREFSKYCLCAADLVMERFTTKEVVLLELDMRNLSNDKKAEVILANRKMKDIVAECISKIIK